MTIRLLPEGIISQVSKRTLDFKPEESIEGRSASLDGFGVSVTFLCP